MEPHSGRQLLPPPYPPPRAGEGREGVREACPREGGERTITYSAAPGLLDRPLEAGDDTAGRFHKNEIRRSSCAASLRGLLARPMHRCSPATQRPLAYTFRRLTVACRGGIARLNVKRP